MHGALSPRPLCSVFAQEIFHFYNTSILNVKSASGPRPHFLSRDASSRVLQLHKFARNHPEPAPQ